MNRAARVGIIDSDDLANGDELLDALDDVVAKLRGIRIILEAHESLPPQPRPSGAVSLSHLEDPPTRTASAGCRA